MRLLLVLAVGLVASPGCLFEGTCTNYSSGGWIAGGMFNATATFAPTVLPPAGLPYDGVRPHPLANLTYIGGHFASLHDGIVTVKAPGKERASQTMRFFLENVTEAPPAEIETWLGRGLVNETLAPNSSVWEGDEEWPQVLLYTVRVEAPFVLPPAAANAAQRPPAIGSWITAGRWDRSGAEWNILFELPTREFKLENETFRVDAMDQMTFESPVRSIESDGVAERVRTTLAGAGLPHIRPGPDDLYTPQC